MQIVKTGVRKFHREIICKRRKTIDLVIFGNSIEIGMVLISDNSGASGSSGLPTPPTDGHGPLNVRTSTISYYFTEGGTAFIYENCGAHG
eukprot:COSAG02_NODE_656_length_18809_cov_17.805077_5_plen_90_part_00